MWMRCGGVPAEALPKGGWVGFDRFDVAALSWMTFPASQSRPHRCAMGHPGLSQGRTLRGGGLWIGYGGRMWQSGLILGLVVARAAGGLCLAEGFAFEKLRR